MPSLFFSHLKEKTHAVFVVPMTTELEPLDSLIPDWFLLEIFSITSRGSCYQLFCALYSQCPFFIASLRLIFDWSLYINNVYIAKLISIYVGTEVKYVIFGSFFDF